MIKFYVKNKCSNSLAQNQNFYELYYEMHYSNNNNVYSCSYHAQTVTIKEMEAHIFNKK